MPPKPRVDHSPWSGLETELDRWADAGRTASFWWRDDDATEETSQLQALDALSRETEVSVSVAVIPARLQASLVEYILDRKNMTVLQHGYAHTSHAAAGVKKIELGGQRSVDDIQEELLAGRLKLSQALGGHFLPVMVPPWNRIESRTYPALINAGFYGLSSMWTRKTVYPVAGLLQVNTHIDPVNWRGDRGHIGDAEAIDQLLRHLGHSRHQAAEVTEPCGILTHHLSQSQQVWDFCSRLFEKLNRHAAARWTQATEIWASEPT